MKQFNTVGCCGIDCGLCPRYHSAGNSVCPGCDGFNFRQKHPSCGYITCCVAKRGLETCADCDDFPCGRFDSECDGYDSFVTHRRLFPNLEEIRTHGIDVFVDQQRLRIAILDGFLRQADDGRSKSFYCLACALLPLDRLLDGQRYLSTQLDGFDVKQRSQFLRGYLQSLASELSIELRLNKKNTTPNIA